MKRTKLNNFAIDTEKMRKQLTGVENTIKDTSLVLGKVSDTMDKIAKSFSHVTKESKKSKDTLSEYERAVKKLSRETNLTFKAFLDDRLRKNITSAKDLIARWSALKDTKKTLDLQIVSAKEKGKSQRTIKPLETQSARVSRLMDTTKQDLSKSLKTDLRWTSIDNSVKAFESGKKKIENAIMGFLRNVFEGAKKITSEMATYNLSTSLFVNREAREQALQYGLSNSRNWAFTQAKSMLGIQSDEDLYYMNQAQRSAFSSLMSKYSAMYDKLESNGYFSKTQDFQLKMNQFTLDTKLRLVKFFAENGNTIMSILNNLLSVGEWILSAVSNIYTFFTGGNAIASGTSGVDMLASTYNSNNSKNVTINSNISATSTEQANDMLKSAENILWTPFIKALEN